MALSVVPLMATPALADPARAVTGDSAVLADAQPVRLAGILAPRPGEPFAEEARAALDSLLAGPLRTQSLGRDRYGRAVVLLWAGDALAQAVLVERGLARVWSFPDAREHVPALLRAEAAAREARRGLWSRAEFRVRDAEAVARDRDSFQLVEGTVLAVGRDRGGRAYLNFGADWRSDFTVSMDGAAQKLIGDPQRFAGRRVRVRGWIESRNGPMITATHPEQIELLD